MKQNINSYFILFIFLIFILFSCKGDKNPVDSKTLNGVNIFLDFQGGFNNDHIEILIDNLPWFNQTITTDLTIDFAKRVRIYTKPDAHNILINLNNGNSIYDTTLYVLDSLFLSIINDTLYHKLFVREMGSLPSYLIHEYNDFQHLLIEYLSGEGYSNFMPPILPDQLGIRVSFEFLNIYDKKIISGIYVEDVYVYKTNGNTLLGQIKMYLWPEFYLYPGASDSISFYYIKQDHDPFEIPCEDSIYLKLNLRDQYYRGIQIKTNSFIYECDS